MTTRSAFASPLMTALALLALAAPAAAQDLLAEYRANSGSLPPEYAWSTTITFASSGDVTLIHCKGYETEGPACTQAEGMARPDALQAILSAVAKAGLVETPAREATDIPVGGGSAHATVWTDGTKVILPAFPDPADAARVGSVMAAITAAIPTEMTSLVEGD